MEETIKSIKIAPENEIKKHEFYLKHRKKTQTLVGRMMFAKIAQEENEHYHRLKDLLQELTQKGKWPETISKIKDTNIKTFLNDLLTKADKTTLPDAEEREAVNIAIKFEAEGYNFYIKLRDSADTELEKYFFGHLAALEHEHLISLQETRDYFNNANQKEKPNQ